MKDGLKLRRLSKSCLELLPVELLYEIQLYALSHSLPCTSRSLHLIFKYAPSSFQAEYIFLRSSGSSENLYTKALRYPLCSLEVLRFIKLQSRNPVTVLELPKRLFRDLGTRRASSNWTDQDHPLPFIRDLYTAGFSLDLNSINGYALTKAVQTEFYALVKLLLDKGASPTYKDSLAVRVAIRRKDLRMVKLLIERSSGEVHKRRRLEDRMKVSKELLKLAVKCNAQDLVDYFTREKGCVPDMQTLYLMR
ncbi:hypothetical protein C8J55DRAFT_557184 [Lentinula edodes]|uniref:Ankyrin n=1 Tax=Lentinula lateritia TaxID=40482 RepID=A0A9W9DYE7_9AGAR|nr:hypothetical protein C8J55DRAFT_557184 [Lentinula edodes]